MNIIHFADLIDTDNLDNEADLDLDLDFDLDEAMAEIDADFECRGEARA